MNSKGNWKKPHARLNRAVAVKPLVVMRYPTPGIKRHNNRSSNRFPTILPATSSRNNSLRCPISNSINSSIRPSCSRCNSSCNKPTSWVTSMALLWLRQAAIALA